MAGIDKIYCSSYEEYKEFYDWAKTQFITFFDGYKINVSNWIGEFEKEDFDNYGEIPITNSPTWLDAYLLQHCKSQFVLNRLNQVYSEDYVLKLKQVDFSKLPNDYKRKRKVIIEKIINTTFPLNSEDNQNIWWRLSCDNDFWYNDDTKKWVHREQMYPFNTTTAHLKTIKSVVKHLRNQYLPKGVVFTLAGIYVGQVYKITII